MKKAGSGGAASALGSASGSVLIALSAVSYSTAGLFTRMISTDLWTMLFFRGMFASLFFVLYLAYVYRGRSRGVLGQISWPTLAATAASTAGGCIILLAVTWHMKKDFKPETPVGVVSLAA